MLAVYLDNNVWNKVRDHRIDLNREFPPEEYRLELTVEGVMEIAPMPDDLRAFVEDTVARCNIQTRPMFGFSDLDDPSASRFGGFGVGRLGSVEQTEFIESSQSRVGPSVRPTGLKKNEGDVALAIRAFDGLVLTLDVKNGPLMEAKKKGWKVVDLTTFDWVSGSLGKFVQTQIY